MMNTASLKSKYKEDGFFVIEDAFPAASLATVRDAAARIVDRFDPELHHSVFSTLDRDRGRDRYFVESAEAIHCFLEQGAIDHHGKLSCSKERAVNKIGHALHDLDPDFKTFCQQDIFAEVLNAIGYEHALLWQSMYIFKQARIGGEVRWHQDASYLISEPASVVGFWIAVEDAHKENGCLWVQPGGHRSPLRDRYVYDHEAGHGELRSIGDMPWPGEAEALPVEVKAGSLVVFHDHMPHYSCENTSDKSRQAFSLHFAHSSSAWSDHNWLQRKNLPPFRV